jgi:hypothetical protein
VTHDPQRTHALREHYTATTVGGLLIEVAVERHQPFATTAHVVGGVADRIIARGERLPLATVACMAIAHFGDSVPDADALTMRVCREVAR